MRKLTGFRRLSLSPTECACCGAVLHPCLAIAQAIAQAIHRGRTRRMAPQQKPPLPSWVVAAGLAVFVAGTYYSTFRRVGGGDLEKELERELEEEARRQEKSGA